MNTSNEKNGNISNKESKSGKWSKKQMEEAEPFPLPEIEEENVRKKDDENNNVS